MEPMNQSKARDREKDDGRFDVDLAIIGTGGAGMAAALKAAENDRTVALIESSTLGGTCVNIGCVPSKTLLRAAEVAHMAKSHPFEGVHTVFEGIDWEMIRRRKNELVAELRQSKYADVLAHFKDRISLKHARARFLDARTLKLDNGEVLRSRRILIATGARPRKLTLPGSGPESFLDSTSLMDIPRFPDSLLVIGGRAVGLELGQAFSRLGSKVTLLQRSERLLPEHEPEIGLAMEEYLAKEGLQVVTEAVPLELQAETPLKRLKVRLPSGERFFEAEQILMAVGRTPNSGDLGLEPLGVAMDAAGFIQVGATLETSVPGIFAAGDVTVHPKLVYLAAKSGLIAAVRALGLFKEGEDPELNLRVLPEVIFTDPQIATVGLTEESARSRGLKVRVVNLPLSQVPRALAARNTQGFIKLVADEKTNRLLGAHMVGSGAGEVIQTAALAIQMGYDCGLDLSRLQDMFFPYLVQVEGLKLAAQAFSKDINTMSCCAG